MSFHSLTRTTLQALNTTGSVSSFYFQSTWAHSHGPQIQRDCSKALDQVLGNDHPFEPLSGGPYSFSFGLCSIGIYTQQPSNARNLRSPETWKNIKHWISDTLLSIFTIEVRPVGSVLNLSSGVQICIWEPTDTDPESRCRTATPYARTRALTLQQCLNQHEVQNTTRTFPSTLYSNEASQTQGRDDGPLSVFHSNSQPVPQARQDLSPSTPLRQDQHQAQGLIGNPLSPYQGVAQYQAQAISEDDSAHSPLLQAFRRPPAPSILQLRGDWTNQPLSAALCQNNLATIRALQMQYNIVANWILSGPIIHHSPPCSVGVYVTNPNSVGGTRITTAWRNVVEYLTMMIGSDDRAELGAYMDLPTGIQLVLYNGAWVDPQNRLADAKLTSLKSELDSLALIMTVNRFRNLSSADYDSYTRLIQEYFY